MEQERLYVDGERLCTGVQQAISRSEEPILCLIKQDTLKLIAVSGLRLVISWETRLRHPVPGKQIFLIPPLVANLLSCEAICSQAGVEFVVHGENIIVRLTNHLGSCEIHWESDLDAFPAPDAFGQLTTVPDVLIEVSYLKFSDATHQAVAKLIRMEAERQASPAKLAVLIDLDLGGLRVDGQEIVATGSRQYYFDPRLVIRALEFIKEPTLRVGITPLQGGQRAYLSLLEEHEGWNLHCALLSIGKDTQRLYPLPSARGK